MHFKALAMADSLLLNVSNTYIFRFIISFIIVILVVGDLKTSNFMYFSERKMHASSWNPNKMKRFFEKLSADHAKCFYEAFCLINIPKQPKRTKHFKADGHSA